MTPIGLVLFAAVFYLVRWLFVLPGLLVVLVGLEYLARRVSHARVLTLVVACAPMVLWELSNSPGGFPSAKGAVLGGTALLFAAVARLPARRGAHPTDDRGPAPPPVETAIAPR